MTKGKKWVFRNTILHGLDQCFPKLMSVFDEDCKAVKVKAHKVRNIDTSFQKELCDPAGAEGWYLVVEDDYLSLLPMGCHPQARDDCSRGHLAYSLQLHLSSNSRSSLLWQRVQLSISSPSGYLAHSSSLNMSDLESYSNHTPGSL